MKPYPDSEMRSLAFRHCLPDGLEDEMAEHVARLETRQDRRLLGRICDRLEGLARTPAASETAPLSRYTADLADGFGNLVSRSLAMIGKYRDGLVPSSSEVTPLDEAGRRAAAA